VTGFGHILGLKAVIERLSEEHGFVRLEPGTDLQIGQVIRIIPNHACPVVNLFDTCFGLRGGEVVQELKVSARGKSQ
jgi:D-serine deaminase-like pyridoxal phosphate-dependent protein